ncbi:matrixin family metalloprotease [archaeon]|nr:matrixin family metalloprotease [archaeon]
MIWKVISSIVIFLMFVFSFAFMIENLPRDPVELKVNYVEPESVEIINYGAVPVFAESLRFNHNFISYFIESDCDEDRRGMMIESLGIFSDEVGIVSFFEGDETSDIKVGCSDEFIELGDNLFAAGEGGPSRIINTSGFKVIEEGKVLLYNGNDCDYPIVALHELGHVFGFSHSDDPKNIMYNTSDCEQRMSEDMVDLMVDLYSIEALADIKIESVDGIVKGRDLDFNISILNEGLLDVVEIDLTIFADGDVVDVVELGEIGIGYGRTLRVENMNMPKSSVDVLEFVVDYGDTLREIRKDNNIVEMIVDSNKT